MFIVFEGIDGVGKSTQISMLANYLTTESIPYVLTREPGSLNGIRDILLHTDKPIPIKSKLILFSADRINNIENYIKPNLDKVVISDRYYYSTYAYQMADGFDKSWIDKLVNLTVDIEPDIIFFMNIAPEKSFARIENPDSFEKKGLEYQSRVYKNYMSMFVDKENVTFLDASKSKDEIFKNVLSEIEKRGLK